MRTGENEQLSKVRVYELAKELGLENKGVLDLCENLGITGKKSHSSTLSEDEADRIRRSVLRQAVTVKDGLTREIEKEGALLTERRVGNVIRRRKKAPGEPDDEPVSTAAPIDLADLKQRTVDIPNLAPDLAQERNVRDEALARANALFRDQQENDLPPLEEPETPPPLVEVASPEPVVEEPVKAAEPIVPEPPAPRADGKGPKILGRIVLQAPPPKRPELNRDARKPAGEKTDAEPGEASKARPSKKKVEVTSEENDELKRPKKKKQVLKKDDLLDYDGERDAWRNRKDKKSKLKRRGGEADGVKPVKRNVRVDSEISVGELARQLGMKATEIIKQLMNLGVMASINQLIDFETASLIASEFGAQAVNIGRDDEAFLLSLKDPEDPETLELRPPVVTVMGHVDHGKTSLLDSIRTTSVTATEAGGITQHIGAYNVMLPSGGSVTFLDTPGHEAFTAMRSRGAKVTDIVVLVVAADDGVMPQTEEAINHAKAAEVPIIVAINKIDKESANPDRIKTQLAERGLIPEDWGGETIVVPVSAHTKKGIDLLLENLYAQAEVLELRANPNRNAYGTVIESKLDRGRGPVLTVLVQNGTLKKGDVFLCGSISGRVRGMIDSDGKPVEEAGPSIPVEVIGAAATPLAGDDFFVLDSENQVRQFAEAREIKERAKSLSARSDTGVGAPLTLESFSARVAAGEMKELPLVVKGDVQGSVEAVSGALTQLQNEEARVKVIHRGVGAITENDVQLAVATGAVIVGFNVRADSRASLLIENEGAQVMYSRIIYELVDSVKAALSGMLKPQFKEKTLGRVEVRQTFKVPKLGVIAGSYVVDGTVQRGALVRLLRDNRVIHEGKMASLRRFKDDVREVQAGYECGIGIDGYSDIHSGDIIEVYRVEEVPRAGAQLQ